ncbi:MAG: ABC transporter ATP-binding protein [Candidatus Aminicenantes bacterium]|nr:ABC transporter ATP-binding protein [Candidatus Aminicenantes bacterium]
MTTQPVMQIRNVSRNYRLGRTVIPALKDVSLDILHKDFLVIAGPSGSGKTTLLNLAGLIDKPDSGEVWIGNEDITRRSLSSLFKFRRDKIGYIFQTFNLIPVMNVYENVAYPLILSGISPLERKAIVDDILRKVGLYERKKHRPKELSGGERQRVSVARAVVKSPDIILADEPTANLDSKTGLGILELMQKFHRENGTTFVFSSHDPRIVAMGKRVAQLQDGEIRSLVEREETGRGS